MHCLKDAEAAWDTWVENQKLRFHHVSGLITEQEVVRKERGRPKQDAQPETDTLYVLNLIYTEEEALVQQARRKASRFVLATTLPKEWHNELMDGTAVLGLYKG
ncbi:hypothetical protein DFP93_10616 [Aneurinibacillus soli]|uniref:Uncharacterized protein n=2 Tax=Aneurinibacillus soli TaxID=1500254 RepID=A0A0U4WN38_9BACL|nr:hypothetical protein DFP93_10616 [Aneurinibacillus soli]BAU29641.1 hypothetical protein CB4_03878 [Aneurinibacillus soli]